MVVLAPVGCGDGREMVEESKISFAIEKWCGRKRVKIGRQ